jgi:predicted transcriptional regulator
MTTIKIDVPDDRAQQLQDLAARLHVAPEDLLRVSLEEILNRPDEMLQQSVQYVLSKNAELYRRLA